MFDVAGQFGPIDIYLFDQLLRGRIHPGLRVLDAGCGGGRNLVFFLRQGYEIFGVDQDADAIDHVRSLAATLKSGLPPENFQVAAIESLPYPDMSFDVVISSAVLHFARDDQQFRAILNETWRVLKTGGLLFCRLASSIGMEKRMQPIAGRRFLLPDGSERYLVDEKLLEQLTRELTGQLLDPIKTTVVQNQRCMTTWVLTKT